MAGAVDGGESELRPWTTTSADTGQAPSYISSHSADVILSDIRPIKLKPEALRAINVLLDEFLSKILSVSCSLLPDKLRASLLSLLPTSLGKEALLEAEVELRAYWERTDPKEAVEDDTRTFHLQWAFSLLRLKCEAYSTLNEQDDDPTAESRVNEMFESVHSHPPPNAMVDPAALYLTAILESLCEHILSNIGRVAARDSSRTSATVNDLFTALCEDESIYGLFRTMEVYEQIETMSKTPKPRRSRSISRTSSPQQEQIFQTPSGSRSRQSSEGQLSMPAPSASASSRTSFEKARAIRMFANNKGSSEQESQSSHKRSMSLRSESVRHVPDDDSLNPAEDAEMLREFDDLMRTTSTMKMSLTPDRLKTMEVYKQEKDQRGLARRPGTQKPEPSPSRPTTHSLPRHVDAIVEDDEEVYTHKGRPRQASVATPPSSSPSVPVSTRSRSISTSSGLIGRVARKPARNASINAAPSSFTQSANIPPAMVRNRDFRGPSVPQSNGFNSNGFPPRTRVRQRNRDSLDLDEVMNGSDGDEDDTPQPVQQPKRSPTTPKRGGTAPVSAKTRELMDFLAEGPPEPPVSKDGRDFMSFLADGPPEYSSSPNEPAKPKGAGRLQRMISKLNLGNGEKVKSPVDQVKSPPPPIVQAIPPRPPAMYAPQQPYGSLSSLANRPIPPRPPAAVPLSPPSSPAQSHESSDENRPPRNSVRKQYPSAEIPRHSPSIEKIASVPTSPVAGSISATPDVSGMGSPRRPSLPQAVHSGNIKTEHAPSKEVLNDVHPVVPIRTFSNPPVRKPVPSIAAAASPSICENDVRDMQRLLANATTADECRLIFDMFMARNGIPRVSKSQAAPYPSPAPSVIKHTVHAPIDTSLETSLVELLLGSSITPELVAQQIQPISVAYDDVSKESKSGFIHENTMPSESATHIAA